MNLLKTVQLRLTLAAIGCRFRIDYKRYYPYFSKRWRFMLHIRLNSIVPQIRRL